MTHAIPVDQQTMQQWIAEKIDPKEIEAKLQASGLDQENIEACIQHFKKLKHSARLFKGFICMGAGALLGFISCILSIINPVPELYNVILFGLTSLAILIICLGMYFVFE